MWRVLGLGEKSAKCGSLYLRETWCWWKGTWQITVVSSQSGTVKRLEIPSEYQIKWELLFSWCCFPFYRLCIVLSTFHHCFRGIRCFTRRGWRDRCPWPRKLTAEGWGSKQWMPMGRKCGETSASAWNYRSSIVFFGCISLLQHQGRVRCSNLCPPQSQLWFCTAPLYVWLVGWLSLWRWEQGQAGFWHSRFFCLSAACSAGSEQEEGCLGKCSLRFINPK